MHGYPDPLFLIIWGLMLVGVVLVERGDDIAQAIREAYEEACALTRVPKSKALSLPDGRPMDAAQLHRVLHGEARPLTIEASTTMPKETLEIFYARLLRKLGIRLYTQEELYEFAGVRPAGKGVA